MGTMSAASARITGRPQPWVPAFAGMTKEPRARAYPRATRSASATCSAVGVTPV
jgi:hypothetical protein